MLELLKIFLYGIIEGISEWLPISSTGHLILIEQWIPLNQSEQFMEFFRVIIQLGAVMAVVVIYFKQLFPLNCTTKKMNFNILKLWAKIIVACLPAAIIGILFDDWIDAHFYNSFVVSLALIIFGV